MNDDERTPQLSPAPSTPAVMWRIAPLVVAALGAAGCTAGEPPAFDAGIQDAGPPGVVDAGIEAPIDSGTPGVVDAGIEAPSDSGPSSE